MENLKAIITDLDRTLLRTDKTISDYSLQVLKHCHDKGILIMAATARPERAILDYHRQVYFDAMTVMNGAYFGDDNDDIEPLKHCGIGVAVANAIDAVKEAAGEVVEGNDEDGVAKWLKRRMGL